MSEGSRMINVSFLTFFAPCSAMASCRFSSSPFAESIRLSLSSTFFGVMFSFSARTMDESLMSFSTMIP